MHIFDLLLGWGGQAIQLTFRYGFLFKEEDFLELTEEQYSQYYSKIGECDEKIFMLAPANPQNSVEADFEELPVVTESQKDAFLEATEVIEKYCEGKGFQTDEEKLQFVAGCMPKVFTEGSKYEKYYKFKVVKPQGDSSSSTTATN